MNPLSSVSSLSSWLSLAGRLGSLDRLARLAALRHDQYHRWSNGERTPAEEYLLHVPGLATDPEMVLDVIYSEVVLRAGLSEEPSEQEYVRRFPDRADSIRRLMVLHRCLRAASREGFTSSDTLTAPVGSSIHALAEPTSEIAPPGYELLSKLGEGSMGVVWKARQTGLRRLVALKLLRRTGDADLKRFRAEAESVARLHHPNIIQVYDSGVHAGVAFLAQELVEGGSLSELLRRGPLPPREAATLLELMARGVQHAHECNVLHRDLKPANVLLVCGKRESPESPLPDEVSPWLALKVTDFGLAKQLDDDRIKTTVGTVLGTPSYMPPEQARGDVQAIGPPSDVYSLGATLYECLTGRPPFRGDNVFDTLVQVQMNEPTALRELNPGVPAELEAICLRCLRKVPTQRYASAAAFADALRRFLVPDAIAVARPVPAPAPVPSRRSIGVAGAFALLTIASGAALFVVHSGVEQKQNDLERSLARTEGERDELKVRLEDGERRAWEWHWTEAEMFAEADWNRRIQKELDAKQQDLEEQQKLLGTEKARKKGQAP